MRRVHLAALALISSIGCVSSYQPESQGGGYSELQLDERTFQVSFRGNSHTSRERARELALLRCADLTLERGFSHFVVLDAESYTRTSRFTAPKTSYTTAGVTALGNTAVGSATTRSYGGQTIHLSRPRTTNTIQLLETAPRDGSAAFDAELVRRSVRAKYELD